MNRNIRTGSRKVVLTKWMLVIFSIGTLGYMALSIIHGRALPETFYMNFVFGLGAIGGAFTVGNIFEHRAQSQIESARARADGEKQKSAVQAPLSDDAEK